MAKFSLFGDDDDEEHVDNGEPSCPIRNPKRPRLALSRGCSPSSASSAGLRAEPQPVDEEDEELYEDDGGGEQEDSDPSHNNSPGYGYSPWRSGSFTLEAGLESPIETDYVSADRDRRSIATDVDRSISVRLTDPDVLDCCICFEPLTIPVFQCENGHTACSSCCTKLRNKCPTCTWPIGYNRCRAIEKVLESIKIACQNKQYGCKETVSYSKLKDHENTCTYSPCSCPLTSCNFVASSEQLYRHFNSRHTDSAVRFSYSRSFSVTMEVHKTFIVLQEETDNVLFILDRRVERLGDAIWVSCISHSSNRWFNYDISAKNEEDTLTLQSTAKRTQGQVDSLPRTGFLLVPSDFLGTSGELKLNLNIFEDGPTPECSERSIEAA